MTWVVVLIAVVLGIAWLKKDQERLSGADEWPYYSKAPLTQPEQVLYYRLTKTLPDSVILAQVQVYSFIKVKGKSERTKWKNKINQLSVDFLVCQNDFQVVAAIELDDRSHLKEEQKERDERKSKALKTAGVRLIRFTSVPSEEEIREAFKETERPLE
jgi:very-short-patch-repair endonuclease